MSDSASPPFDQSLYDAVIDIMGVSPHSVGERSIGARLAAKVAAQVVAARPPFGDAEVERLVQHLLEVDVTAQAPHLTWDETGPNWRRASLLRRARCALNAAFGIEEGARE